MDITVRTAQDKDFKSIIQLINEFALIQKKPERVSNTAALMAEEKDSFNCLVAELDGQIVGYAIFFICYYSWIGKSLYLDDLYVSEQYRSHKVGSSLLEKVIEEAKSKNCKKVRWQVSNWNEKTIDFYRDFGATIGDLEINCDLAI